MRVTGSTLAEIARRLQTAQQQQKVDGTGTGGTPTVPTATDSFEVKAEASVAVEINPDSVSIEAEAEAGISAKGPNVGVSASVEVSANLEQEVTREDGMVTVTITADASVTAEGKLDIRAVSIGGSASAGGNVTYQVRMSEADYQRMVAGEIPPPNPLDPATIPDGASVRLDQSQFVGTSLEAGFRYHALELGISSSTTETTGTSLLVARDGDQVTVTAGPTNVLEATNGVSVGIGPVTFKAGRADELGVFNLRTATFDLSTPAGQAAFSSFATTGQLPEVEGPGVSNALRIEHITYNSQSSVGLELGPIDLNVDLGENDQDLLIVRHSDGTTESTLTLQYDGEPQLAISKKFDAEGNEITAETRYTYTFTTTDDASRALIYEAFTGEVPPEDFETSDAPFTVTFTQEQMTAFQGRVAGYREIVGAGEASYSSYLSGARGPDDMAVRLVHYSMNQTQVGEALFGFYSMDNIGSAEHRCYQPIGGGIQPVLVEGD